MNIKKRIPKFISLLLSFTIAFGNVIPAYAMENTNSDSATVIDGEDIKVDERNLEDITVTYKQASSFFVTIPKRIVLDGWKQSTYAVKVSGDIDAEQCVYVAPIDGIADTENIDFYMKEQVSKNAKDDVVATITHNKFHWNSAEVAEGYKQDDNLVSAPDLTAGAWRGIFQLEIKLETHVTHKHNYVATITKAPTCTEAGEKTYTCTCGHSYTEVIPAKGHHYGDDDKCTGCGELNPDHKHSYTERITKEPTCTEAGEKTYTCKCGDSYKEVIPATGHSYVDGECEHCHEKDPDYHKHSYTERITKEPTCTETGEKTFTCICGHSYIEVIPAKGHHYGDDDKCTGCGELNPDHKHSYTERITKEPTCTEAGEKTFTCICGNSYTEVIPATGHSYVEGECEHCHEKDPNYHKHSYDEGVVTKEPTCTEAGEKTYTCDCGDSYTEEIPATGHNYGNDNRCTKCGEKHTHDYVDGVCTGCGKVARYVTDISGTYSNWDYTLDDANNIITLNYYKGNQSNVVVYANYMINGKTYKTQLKSNDSNAGSYYMFAASGTKSDPAKTMKSIIFSDVLDTSNVTNMRAMFSYCKYLTSIDFGDSFDTSNVTNMSWMFYCCQSLTSLDLSRFNTGKVTDMNHMFYMYNSYSALAQINFGDNFDTSNVTNMSYMFDNCTSLTNLDLSSFDTSNVTDMSGMFYMYNSNSKLSSLDLSGWNTSKVTSMTYMFYNSSALKVIYATEGKWSTSQAKTTSMFSKCGTSTVTYK